MEIDKFILKGQSINIVDKKSQQAAQNAVTVANAAKNTANLANTKSDTVLNQIADLHAEISEISETVDGNTSKIEEINNYNISFSKDTINFTKIGGIKK